MDYTEHLRARVWICAKAGAVCISVLLSLVATPTAYFLMLQLREARVFKLLRQRE